MSVKILIRAGLMALVVSSAACGGNGNKGGSDAGMNTPGADMALPPTSPPDLATPSCVANPVTGNDFLNACTTAQTGDPAKDYPYFPKLAPGGKLPPTN
jgi:hypothetical protein